MSLSQNKWLFFFFFFSANQLVLVTAENVNASEFCISTNLKSHQINSEESFICGYFDCTGKNSQQKVNSVDFKNLIFFSFFVKGNSLWWSKGKIILKSWKIKSRIINYHQEISKVGFLFFKVFLIYLQSKSFNVVYSLHFEFKNGKFHFTFWSIISHQ